MMKHIELFWVLLLGLPITLPAKILPLKWHPYLLLALFLWTAIRYWQLIFPRSQVGWLPSSSYGPHPLTLCGLLLLLCFPVSLWASVDKAMSWSAAGYVLWGIALFDALIHYPLARAKPELVACFFLGAGLLFSVVVLPIVAWKPQFLLFHLALYDQLQTLNVDLGETIHANVLASVVAILLPTLFACVIQQRIKLISRIVLSAAFLLLLGILILTQSRGAYLAMLIVLPGIVVLRWPKLRLLMFGVLFIALCGLFYLGSAQAVAFLRDDGSLGGWSARMDVWTQSIQAIYDFAFTGIGFGTFSLIMPLLYPLKVSVTDYPHAHNLFLQIGVDLGLTGLIVYLGILCTLWLMLIEMLRTFSRESPERMLTIGAMGSLLAMSIHGVLDAAIWVSKIAFFPWILFALITLLFIQAKTTSKDNQQSQES